MIKFDDITKDNINQIGCKFLIIPREYEQLEDQDLEKPFRYLI